MTISRVYGLELARWTHFKASDWFYRYLVYGVGDPPRPMSCFVWVLLGDTGVVLVDCGPNTETASKRGLEMDRDLIELLHGLGVTAEDVDHVVLSHLHFDHTGNIAAFPRASFSLCQAELDFWTGPHGNQPALAAPVDQRELQQVLDLQHEGRLILFDEELEIVPGVRTRRVGGHTPGQTITTVEADDLQIVLAGDSIHYYEEMRENRLYNTFTSATEMLDTYALLRELEARPDTVVVAGHDPQVMERFTPVSEGCVDLAAPIGR